MGEVQKLHAAVDALLREKPRAIIAVDGMCAAGKSMLARGLAARYDANIFHMDDFFLPAERKTALRLSQPGGNVDYERFFAEVLAPLVRGEAVTYRRYDCRAGALGAPILVPPRPLAVVEGAYGAHPYFGDPYDYIVFMRVDAAEQRRRILSRNGEAMLARFENEWIPLEHAYFDAFGIREKCDLVLG